MNDYAKHMAVEFDRIPCLVERYVSLTPNVTLAKRSVEPHLYVFDDNVRPRRTVQFRTTPHTRLTLSTMVAIGNSLDGVNKMKLRDKVASVLEQVDPAMLITLRHIFVVRTWDDLRRLARTYRLDLDTVPEFLTDERNRLSTDYICTFWKHADSIIVNVRAITEACPALEDYDMEQDGEDYETRPLARIAAKDYFWYPMLKALRLRWHHGGLFVFPWDVERDLGDNANENDAAAYAKWAVQNLNLD